MSSLATIYYISQGINAEAHLENIARVCRLGCKLVQLRLKNFNPEEVFKTAEKASVICEAHNATLIINDHIEVAEKWPHLGLHIGKKDIEFGEARKRLGQNLIGGTANTIDDCLRLAENGADYIGLGPYRFTNTKAKLDPIIGLDGYRNIMNELLERQVNIPIYAIGGIGANDIPQLINAGVNGIAVSSLLTQSDENNIKRIISHYE